MLDVNFLLNLASIPPNERDRDSLEQRFSRLEGEINDLLTQVSPTIFDQIVRVSPSELMLLLQPIGALERQAWLVVHQASGVGKEVAKLQAIVEGLLECWVILLALSRHGGIHDLEPLSAEALTGTRDWLSRTSSSTMSFFWINWNICQVIIEIVRAEEDWRRALPSVTLPEFIGLMTWSGENFLAAQPMPLSKDQLGYQLGYELAMLSSISNISLRHAFEERSLTSAPLRLTDDGLILATPRTFPTRTYLAFLELIDANWNSGTSRKGQAPRGKGTLFELTVQQLLERFLGPSDAGVPPFALKLASGKETDLDCCWKVDDVWIVAECKAYSSSRRADDAFTKLDSEVNLICDQLTLRAEALHAQRPVRSTSGKFWLSKTADLIRLGVTVDTAHSLTFREDQFGKIHIFTLEGLVAMLGALEYVSEIQNYLNFREDQLATNQFEDECDLLIAFISKSPPALFRLPSPSSIFFQPATSAAWRKFLVEVPILVE